MMFVKIQSPFLHFPKPFLQVIYKKIGVFLDLKA